MPWPPVLLISRMQVSASFIIRSWKSLRPASVVMSTFSSLNQPRGLVGHFVAVRARKIVPIGRRSGQFSVNG